jgi:hypothetical protein
MHDGADPEDWFGLVDDGRCKKMELYLRSKHPTYKRRTGGVRIITVLKQKIRPRSTMPSVGIEPTITAERVG